MWFMVCFGDWGFWIVDLKVSFYRFSVEGLGDKELGIEVCKCGIGDWRLVVGSENDCCGLGIEGWGLMIVGWRFGFGIKNDGCGIKV